MRGLRQSFRRFARAEDGAGTAMALATLMLMLMVVALAVDVANLYRYRAVLQVTADSAAHAGAVALARTGRPEAAEAAARAMVERNLPEAGNGPLVAAGDIRVVFHDAAAGSVVPLADAPGEANAVVVRLQRSGATGNRLPTLMLRVLGQADWTLAAASVATLEPTQRCAGRQAMVAQGGITLGQGVALEAGLCLHAQGDITLAAGADAGPDPSFSLPDSADCTGACPEGARLAEANLILTPVAGHVERLAQALLDPAGRAAAAADPVYRQASAAMAGFFGAWPLAGDLEPLREVGIDTAALETGSVVRLTALQFSSLRARPAGLIYGVMCTGQETTEVERTVAFQGQPDMGGDGAGPAALRGAVLVTNCRITMDALTVIEGAVLIALHAGPLQVTAEEGARLGAPPGQCAAGRHLTLLTPGDIALEGRPSVSDATLVAGGDVTFLPPPRTGPPTDPAGPDGARVLAGLSDPFLAHLVDPMAEMAPFVAPEIDPETGEVLPPKAPPAPKAQAAPAPAAPVAAPVRSAPRKVPVTGLAVLAGGRISAEGDRLFLPCPDSIATALAWAPPLRRIAHAMPDLGGLLAPMPGPRNAGALPGRPGTSLPDTPADRPEGGV